MKILAYAVRPDEIAAFHQFEASMGLEITYINEQLGMSNVAQSEGFEAVTFLGNCDASRPVLEALKANGVKFLASRSAGFNNVDMEALKELGLRFSNATYSPYCVADFTVMLILMSIRNMKTMMLRGAAHDHSLAGLQGKEMHNLTFGVVGTGRIGAAVVENLSGFNGRILAYDVYENASIKDKVSYVPLETLLQEADVITLHTPLLDSTYHLINKETLAMTKPGVAIINCARAELIDTDALIESIESGHVGACGLDVFPNEIGIVHTDLRNKTYANHHLAILNSHKNVIVTPHSAFYTDQAVSDMVEVALASLKSFNTTNESPNEIR
ncbi:lactate dehydrogenase [Erysipelothrix sp. HDW6B]|uniref:D-isomer specific 2-hydroxyacid dehydrogenase family protein n=1 Tax=Erysipelothrix TaxID=1647 RepID=UPI00135ADABD|nr:MULTISPECIES: D-isomer specific 2-hydroxyacid dehydrogenase family protein [Erysipelothrix]QIK85592.1 lactate dehydrogenase [Erysipelothrix sp. HDW6B]